MTGLDVGASLVTAVAFEGCRYFSFAGWGNTPCREMAVGSCTSFAKESTGWILDGT
jgi:hypothetical protein